MDIKDFIEKNHYSHSINGVKVSACFSVRHNGQLAGGILFGAMSTTAWKKFAAQEQEVMELRRLVLLDSVPRNSESMVVGWSLRWIGNNMPMVKVVVSYADPAHGHSGIIYRASNFKYLGLSGSDTGFKDPETGKTYHSRALRTRYNGQFKPFCLKLRKKLELGQLEKVKLPGKHCYIYQIKP